MSGTGPSFGNAWIRGAGPPSLVTHVARPQCLRRYSLRLVGCRAFTWGPSVYDMFVVDAADRVVPFVAQGERGMAAVNVGGRRYYVHRLAAFSTVSPPRSRWRPWGNARRRSWSGSEVHHYPDLLRPRRAPWADSRRRNMIVWTAAEHRVWHRAHPHVPHV